MYRSIDPSFVTALNTRSEIFLYMWRGHLQNMEQTCALALAHQGLAKATSKFVYERYLLVSYCHFIAYGNRKGIPLQTTRHERTE